MRTPFRPGVRPSLSWFLLCALFAVLLIAGGASRADAPGQAVAQGGAWLLLIVTALFGPRPSFGRAAPVWILLAAGAVLALVQLIPLPPLLWQALPGRGLLVEAAAASGQAQPWRPWSMVPDATAQAAASLIVPAVVLLLASGVGDEERRWLPGLMLCLVTVSMLIGLLQVSVPGFGDPLVNAPLGMLTGPFANRNHFALFLALGCLLVPAWAFAQGRRPHWRAPVGFGLILLFLLMILATGSRAGTALGVLAFGIGLAMARQGIRRELSRYPSWAFPALIAAMVAVIAGFVLVSVAHDRAASIDRAFTVDPGQDMRGRALPVVLDMVRTYFPWGSGFGGFDPMFRIHEPLGLLKPTYFNHAHDDLLELVLDGGLPALLLLLAAVLWWGRASLRAWTGPAGRQIAPKLGSAMLLLVLIASLFDYPARTPLVMATIALAALWLAEAARRPALPTDDQHL